MAVGKTTAQRALEQRRKNRRLPTVDDYKSDDLALNDTVAALLEHIRMYEGDSGAPKERFVTMAELENAGLLRADVKQGFAYVKQVLDKDVAQQAGSTANPTQKNPVKKDTSLQGRVPGTSTTSQNQGPISYGSGGGGGGEVGRLGGNEDVFVASPAQNHFLAYDGTRWTNFALFDTQNAWTKQQTFDKPLRLLELIDSPPDTPVEGYLLLWANTDGTIWLTNDAGASTQIAAGADHGGLSGLGDDDHPQYGEIATTETVTGDWAFEGLVVTDLAPALNDGIRILYNPANGDAAIQSREDPGNFGFGDLDFRADLLTCTALGNIEWLSVADMIFDAINITLDADVTVANGSYLRVEDTGSTDYAEFSHDGTDFNLDFVNTTDFNINDVDVIATGGALVAEGGLSTASTDGIVISHNGTSGRIDCKNTGGGFGLGDMVLACDDLTWAGAGTILFSSLTDATFGADNGTSTLTLSGNTIDLGGPASGATGDVNLNNGRSFVVWDSGENDGADLSNDGTDLTLAVTTGSLTDFNINDMDVRIEQDVFAANLPEIIPKTADQTTTSTTPVDITDLKFTPTANTSYLIEFFVMVETDNTAGTPQLGISWPGGMNENSAIIQHGYNTTGTTNYPLQRSFGGSGDAQLESVTALTAANTPFPYWGWAIIDMGASPTGDFDLQIEVNNGAYTITVKAESLMRVTKIS